MTGRRRFCRAGIGTDVRFLLYHTFRERAALRPSPALALCTGALVYSFLLVACEELERCEF
ncbi:MAG TPA: hypothetical protein VFD48_06455, partial [Pyrinomonadaceae bacterium]|nr:hypothetical protein [Pyrinomonadaceae bacterium]